MRWKFLPLFAALLFLGLASPLPAGDDGFKPMFNGKDLTGWHNVNCAPETFFVKDNMIITTGKPTGFLRTDKQYENFIMEFEWMHMNTKEVGNSGLFVWGDPIPAVGTGYTRGIEVQVLVNLTYKDKQGRITASSHGDLFSIWGAKCVPDRPHPSGSERCLPSENRCKGGGEWNHYRVEANDGVIKLAVNGKVVSGVSKCNPRKGYLALESEGAECRFKNLKIKERPSTNPKPAEIADVAKDYKALFLGDLRGWKKDKENQGHWKPIDWRLESDGKGKHLWTEKEYGNFELIVDWRPTGKVEKDLRPVILRTGKDDILTPRLTPKLKGQWNRSEFIVKNKRLTQIKHNGKDVMGEKDQEKRPPLDFPARGPIGLGGMDGESMQFANIFIRELE